MTTHSAPSSRARPATLREWAFAWFGRHVARRAAGRERLGYALDQRQLGPRLRITAARPLGQRFGPAFHAFEVGEQELGLDGLDVAQRVDRALDMGDAAALVAAHHMGDGVDLADVAEELVAQPLAPAGAAHQAGDVDELDLGRHHARRTRDPGKLGEPAIGHRDPRHVGLDGAEWVVLGRRAGTRRQGIEQGRLADVGQAGDAAPKTHCSPAQCSPAQCSPAQCSPAQRSLALRPWRVWDRAAG